MTTTAGQGFTQSELDLWKRAFRLEDEHSLAESAAAELASYFGRPIEEMHTRLLGGASAFAEEWRRAGVDATDQAAATQFYRESTTELFELMEVHALRPQYPGRRYVKALQAIRSLRPSAQRYLDFGSGIGTGALVFRQAGFDVTLADVATVLLDFCRWRFARRALTATFVDLVTQDLPFETFDVATCFDVLEHVANPREVMARLRRALKPGGVAILRVSPVHDEDHPMHVVHDVLMPYGLEELGFRYDCNAMPPGFQVLIRDDSRRRIGLWSRALARGCDLAARDALRNGHYAAARRYAWQSLAHYPFSASHLALACALVMPTRLLGDMHGLWRGMARKARIS